MTEMWSRMLAWGNGLVSRSVGSGRLQGAAEGVLPVNLGSYDYARSGSTQGKIQNIDQTLVWVVVALLMWGMVMVYSASIAMPDNPKFAKYSQTHFWYGTSFPFQLDLVLRFWTFRCLWKPFSFQYRH